MKIAEEFLRKVAKNGEEDRKYLLPRRAYKTRLENGDGDFIIGRSVSLNVIFIRLGSTCQFMESSSPSPSSS